MGKRVGFFGGMCLCFVPESSGRDYCILSLQMRLKADHVSGLAGSSELWELCTSVLLSQAEAMGSVGLG